MHEFEKPMDKKYLHLLKNWVHEFQISAFNWKKNKRQDNSLSKMLIIKCFCEQENDGLSF